MASISYTSAHMHKHFISVHQDKIKSIGQQLEALKKQCDSFLEISTNKIKYALDTYKDKYSDIFKRFVYGDLTPLYELSNKETVEILHLSDSFINLPTNTKIDFIGELKLILARIKAIHAHKTNILVAINDQKEKLKLSEYIVKHITQTVYNVIVKEYNYNLFTEVLEGNMFSLGTLGSFFIHKVDKTYRKKMKVDWEETNKLKAELIAKGIPLCSKENPDGAKYIIYKTATQELYFGWKHFMNTRRDTYNYRFEFIRSGNKKYYPVCRLGQLMKDNPLFASKFNFKPNYRTLKFK